MSSEVRWFLRSAVIWLAMGLLLGMWMGAHPERTAMLRAAHLHALLPGFVLLMIFGVGYHVFPRFSGRPVPWAPGPMIHLVLTNLGLTVVVSGFLLRISQPALAATLIPVGGALIFLGACLFIHAVWRLTERPSWTP